MSTIKVNTIEKKSGSTLTLGGSGTAVNLACGATQSGFGRTGTVDWCSTIYTNSPGTITSVSGKGYFINTTSGAVTINLPSSPNVGDIISVKDYARTFDTNALSIGRGGSKMDGVCADTSLSSAGASATLIYADSTKGWMFINEDTVQQAGASFVTATGGTVTTSGSYKIHTFTSDANFVVSNAGNSAGSNKVSYLVLAGGGGGAGNFGNYDGSAGAGAGGYREGRAPAFDSYTASPLVAPDGVTVSAQTYPITVGAGGAGGPATGAGSNGANSVFNSITSTGGGGGNFPNSISPTNGAGGSGSGAAATPNQPNGTAGAGNTPPVSPPQGNPGGGQQSSGASAAGGGGGAGAVGGSAPSNTVAGEGGAGVTSEINASPVQRAGGGGGSSYPANTGGNGGAGGGGDGGRSPNNSPPAGEAGTANTGGGGGASNANPGNPSSGGTGGSGIVIIRYKFQ